MQICKEETKTRLLNDKAQSRHSETRAVTEKETEIVQMDIATLNNDSDFPTVDMGLRSLPVIYKCNFPQQEDQKLLFLPICGHTELSTYST